MYLDYFGLSRLPFSIAPDPELLYLSPSHSEALAHLNYALTAHGGLICLTGEVGMGKTTLCRAFIDEVPDHVDIAYIFNPMLSAPELLQSICTELEVIHDESVKGTQSNKQLIDCLYQTLLSRYSNGRKVICIIDEAQSMPAPLLEQIRLLTNLETNREKLLTVILVGQPELQDILAQHSVRQLNQRITARFHLPAMKMRQLKPYLHHRMLQAKGSRGVFSSGAISAIWAGSNGIPRVVNSIADRALLGAYATNNLVVSKRIAKQAAKEVIGNPNNNSFISKKSFALMGLGCVFILLLLRFNTENLTWPPSFMGNNVYQDLALSNGLLIESADFSSCKAIEENSGLACLFLDWTLADLKTLKQSIAVNTGARWAVTTSSELIIRPVQSMVLWQPVEGYKKPVAPGQSHTLITWVRRLLANEDSSNEWRVIAPNGEALHKFHSYYDPILAKKVERFQRQVGLNPDKVIGLKTLLALQARELQLAKSEEAL